jgi:hypothetical protein
LSLLKSNLAKKEVLNAAIPKVSKVNFAITSEIHGIYGKLSYKFQDSWCIIVKDIDIGSVQGPKIFNKGH